MIEQELHDLRIDEAEEQIATVQGHIAEAEAIVRQLPEEHQAAARKAMLHIFDAGQKLGMLNRMPGYPVDPDVLEVGSSLRNHIVRCRNLHAEVLAATKMGEKVTKAHLRNTMTNQGLAA